MIVPVVHGILSWLTLIGTIFVALAILSFIATRFVKIPLAKRIWAFMKKHAIGLAFIIALIATSGSLFYSEVAGYDPCRLCWYQRIFVYPMVILFGIAHLKKDKRIFGYAAPLAIIAGLIAAYHYSIQMRAVATPGISDACSATGASCVSSEFFAFGFITIPFMDLIACILILLLALAYRK